VGEEPPFENRPSKFGEVHYTPAAQEDLPAHIQTVFGKLLVPEMAHMDDAQIMVKAFGASGGLVVIWGYAAIYGAYSAYGFETDLPGYLPVGSDGGGKLLTVHADGLFSLEAGDLDPVERVFLAPSLKQFLKTGKNLMLFLDHYLE